MVPPVVTFRSVVALIDRFPVLAGLDLEARAGEIVLLRGPNGAGKTSLLRAVAGLLPISQGEASVLGIDVIRDPRLVRKHVGLLAHESLLYRELTAFENVEFVARAVGLDRSCVAPALDRVGLPRRVRELAVDRLSAGQRRRVSIAALIARDPMLWLLDEPHTGLDHDARELLDAVVRDAGSRGRTVLFSSHEVDRVRHVADTEVYIENGVVNGERSSTTGHPKHAQRAEDSIDVS